MNLTIVSIFFCLIANLAVAQFPAYIDLSKDSNNFTVLHQELKNAAIVMLGEAAHTPQYYSSKVALVKYLHEELNYDVLAFESGMYAMACVDADITQGISAADAFGKGVFPIWANDPAFQQLYPYIDSLRRAGDTLIIAGFDWQISGSYTGHRFVKELREALQTHHVTVDEKTLSKLQRQIGNLESGVQGLTSDFSPTDLASLSALQQRLAQIRGKDLLSQSLLAMIGHFSDLYDHKIFEKSRSGTFGGTDSNPRDSAMAHLLMILHRDFFPGKKIMAWGASLHFMKSCQMIDFGSFESKDFVPMGAHLHTKLGDKVFHLGVSADLNIPGSFEDYMHQRDVRTAWVGSRALRSPVFLSTAIETPGRGNWSTALDGLLYVSSDTDVESRFITASIVNAQTHEPVPFASVTIEETSYGTASSDDGVFQLKVDAAHTNKSMKISAIGYKNTTVPIRKLVNQKSFVVTLVPEVEILNEVLVVEKAISAKEILSTVVAHIPKNYNQSPFNMEFYSRIMLQDTIQRRNYLLESVFQSYYDGVKDGSAKNHRVLHKRETGDYFVRENTHGMAQWVPWELAYNEIYSTVSEDRILHPQMIDKIAPKFHGWRIFDGDTVFVITYRYHVDGELYIAAKDHAVLRHVTYSSGKGYKNRCELLYKKIGNYYYPYAALGDYFHDYKVHGKKVTLKIMNRALLQHIEVDNVQTFEHRNEHWQVRDVRYDKTFWNNYLPSGN